MRFKSSLALSLGFAACSLFTNVAQATPITGMANVAGSVNVTATSISFVGNSFLPTAGGTQTGSFVGITGGTIQNLTGGPATGAVNIPSFATFTTAGPMVVFNLTNIAAGAGTLAGCSSSAVGALCTPTNSPFTLVQLNSNSVAITLTLTGEGYTGSAATGTSPTSVAFSTQIVAPGTIPAVLAAINQPGGIVGSSYSATFTAAPVPEPASMLLLGMGLIGAGLVARRKING